MIRTIIILISIVVYVFYFFVLSNCNPDSIEKYNNKYMRRKPYQDPRHPNNSRQNNIPPNREYNQFTEPNINNEGNNSDNSFGFGIDFDQNGNNSDVTLEDFNIDSFDTFSESEDGLQDLFTKEVDPQSNIGNTF